MKILQFVLLLFILDNMHASGLSKNSKRIRNINCYGCHASFNYSKQIFKQKIKNILKKKEPNIMKTILNGITDKDIDYLANKYGKK